MTERMSHEQYSLIPPVSMGGLSLGSRPVALGPTLESDLQTITRCRIADLLLATNIFHSDKRMLDATVYL